MHEKGLQWTCAFFFMASLLGCLRDEPLPQPPAGEFAYGSERNEALGSMALTPAGDILLVGGMQDGQGSDYDLLAMRIGADGEQGPSVSLGTRGYEEVGWAVAPTGTGDFIVFGTKIHSANFTTQYQLTLLDADLQVRWQTLSVPSMQLAHGNAESARIYPLPNGGYIVGFINSDHPVVARFDDEGRLVDDHLNPNLRGNGKSEAFTRLHDGRFAFITTSIAYTLSYGYFFAQYYDSLGNYLEQREMQVGQSISLMPYAALGLGDGRVAMSFQEVYGNGSIYALLDPALGTVETFPSDDYEITCSLVELAGGRVLKVGHDNASMLAYNTHGHDGRIELRDATGGSIRATGFGGKGLESLKQGLALPDGRVALAGETQSYGAGGTDLYLVFHHP